MISTVASNISNKLNEPLSTAASCAYRDETCANQRPMKAHAENLAMNVEHGTYLWCKWHTKTEIDRHVAGKSKHAHSGVLQLGLRKGTTCF